MSNVRIFVMVIGFALSFFFLFYFFQSGSPLDLFWTSIGLLLFICGFYIEDHQITERSLIFWFSGVNVFQWTILVYIYFFNRVYMTIDFYLMLIAVSLFTISLFGRFFHIPLFSFNNDKKIETVRSGVTWNRKQTVLVLLGIIVCFAFLIIFFLFKSFLSLYFSPIGIMIIIYGYYLEINKIKMSFKYLLLMLSVIMIQVILAFFLRSIHIILYDEMWNLLLIPGLILTYLFLQIRRSDMKYIGIYREKSEDDYAPVNNDIHIHNYSYTKLNLSVVQRTPEAFIGENVQITGQITSKEEIKKENRTITNIVLGVQGLSEKLYLIVSYPNIFPFKEGDNVTVYGEYYFPVENQSLKEIAGKKLPGIKAAYVNKA